MFTKSAMVGETKEFQPGAPAALVVKILPGDEMKTANITGLKEVDSSSFIMDKSQITVQYVPEGFENVRVFESKPMPPRLCTLEVRRQQRRLT